MVVNVCRRQASSQTATPTQRQRRLRAPPVEHARAAPGQREGAEQHGVGEIDRQRIRHRAVQAEQHDRGRAHQMGAAPPGQRALAEVLRPREKQQQAEHDLDVHRDHEKRVDVEVHGDQRKRGAGLSGMAASYRLPTKQGVKGRRRSGLIAVARLAKPCPRPRNFSVSRPHGQALGSFSRRPDVGTQGGRAKTAQDRNYLPKGVGNELDGTPRAAARDRRRQALRFSGIGVRRDFGADRRRSRLRGDDVRGLGRLVQRAGGARPLRADAHRIRRSRPIASTAPARCRCASTPITATATRSASSARSRSWRPRASRR